MDLEHGRWADNSRSPERGELSVNEQYSRGRDAMGVSQWEVGVSQWKIKVSQWEVGVSQWQL